MSAHQFIVPERSDGEAPLSSHNIHGCTSGRLARPLLGFLKEKQLARLGPLPGERGDGPRGSDRGRHRHRP